MTNSELQAFHPEVPDFKPGSGAIPYEYGHTNGVRPLRNDDLAFELPPFRFRHGELRQIGAPQLRTVTHHEQRNRRAARFARNPVASAGRHRQERR
ncbi:hypothetical protein SDC9_179357 [bioreactor metagenome]|uniref:Uncharacterized protein n=1 Tax=bioreactor metagenome TaxID=1076179 RepID=A0A645H0Q2_9ZZZZ